MGLSNAGAPTVSEPNLKLRYKPKKSLEQRKNPLLRKESAPPSLRRRPAETLGGEDQQRGQGWLISSLWARSHRGRGSLLRAIMGSWLYSICPTLLQGGRLGLKANPCSLCPEEGVPLKKNVQRPWRLMVVCFLPILLGGKWEAEATLLATAWSLTMPPSLSNPQTPPLVVAAHLHQGAAPPTTVSTAPTLSWAQR